MKYRYIIYFLILNLFFMTSFCSSGKPILKKKLSECSARDILEFGRALFNEEYYEEAIEEYRKLIARFPKAKQECSWAQYELAYSYYYMEEYEEALAEFKKVEMLYPDIRGPIILTKKMIANISVIIY